MIIKDALKLAGGVVAVGAFVSTILTGWFKIESTIETTVAASTAVITKELHQRTLDLAITQRDDLRVRARMLERDIEDYRQDGRVPPERLSINLESLKDQIEELERKWFAPRPPY